MGVLEEEQAETSLFQTKMKRMVRIIVFFKPNPRKNNLNRKANFSSPPYFLLP